MAAADPVTALALAAGAGDRAALAEFIRTTQADVWRFVAHLAGRDVADDLTQETYLRVLEALPRFEGRASALAWLLAIARRAVADRVRYERARPRPVVVDWTEAADLLVTRPDPSSDLRLAEMLELLEPDRREALLLTQLMGFSYADAAEVCGCPVGTIRSRVARARADLVAALDQQPSIVP
jgi:RNA polymerase sigma-70 factor (ECF subfamily)